MIRPTRAPIRKGPNGVPILNRNPVVGIQMMGAPGTFMGNEFDDGPRQIPTEGVATGLGRQTPADIQAFSNQQQPQQPQFGLSGAEQAIQAGLGAGASALEQGVGQAAGSIGAGVNQGLGQINQGIAGLLSGSQSAAQNILSGTQSALGQINNARSGALDQLNMARGGAERNISQGIDAFRRGETQGLGAIRGAIQQGVDPLQGFISPGRQAQQTQAALSGALGPEAQAQAFNQFTESPGQAFLREQGQNAIINQAAATGGLGGGNVLRELQRQGQGLAAQDLQNQFNRLGQVTGTGLQAAGQVGQLRGQQAGLESNLIGSTARGIGQLRGQGAGIESQLGQAGAGIESQLGQVGSGIQQQGSLNVANLLRGASQDISRLRGQGANMAFQGGSQIGGIEAQAGGQAANMFDSASRFIGANRIQAGRDISSQIGGVSQGLSRLAEQQGTNISNQIGQGATNIGNVLGGAGQFDAGQMQQLATLLANLASQQGSASNQANQAMGQARAGGITGSAAGLRSGLGSAAGAISTGLGAGSILSGLGAFFSDQRLKEDIKHAGKFKGHNLYTWKWNDKIPDKSLIGLGGFGVIAQEVEKDFPHLISEHESGYKIVNYEGLFNG